MTAQDHNTLHYCITTYHTVVTIMITRALRLMGRSIHRPSIACSSCLVADTIVTSPFFATTTTVSSNSSSNLWRRFYRVTHINHNEARKKERYKAKKKKRFTPTRSNPAKITPVFDGENKQVCMHFIERILETKCLEKLVNIFKKYDNLKLNYHSHPKQWAIDTRNLKYFDAQKFREELSENNFELGRLPGFDEGSSPAVTTAERIAFGMEDENTVAIIQCQKAFLIVCSPYETKISDIITNKLTGVTDKASENQFDGLQFTSRNTTYVTYDIWLIAEFTDMLKDRQLDISWTLCDDTKESLNSRFDDRRIRQKPIEAVTAIINDGCNLYPHQNEGVRFLQDNGGRGLISFGVGLGKTATTLAYIASEGKRAVVVCPKNVRSVWVGEALQLFPQYFSEYTMNLGSNWNSKKKMKNTERELSQARLVCINYEALNKFLPFIQKAGCECLVLDESHFLKNPKAERTKTIIELKDYFQHRILLSGTPIKNLVSDLATQLEIVGIDGYGELDYKTPGVVWNWLHEQKVYIKKTMEGEFSHHKFGEPQLIDVEVDQDSIEDLDTWYEGDILTQFTQKILEAAQIKVPETCKFVMDTISNSPDSKAIIFTERRKIAEDIHASLQKEDPSIAALHHGGFSSENRIETLNQFEKDDSLRILVSTRQSLAVGVNLQYANIVIFNDMPWSPADIIQSAGRVRRLNQKKSVSEYWMKSNTNFDERLLSILETKLKLIKQYAEGINLQPDTVRWMNKRVGAYEIAGIARPLPKKKKK